MRDEFTVFLNKDDDDDDDYDDERPIPSKNYPLPGHIISLRHF